MTARSGPRHASALRPFAPVLLAILSLQAGAAIGKSLFPELGTQGTAGARTALAAIVLVALIRPRARSLNRRQWLAVGLYGVVLGTMNLCIYLSMARIPLGLAVTIEFLGPLGVAAAGSRRWLDGLWVVLAAAGVMLLSPLSWLGDRTGSIDLLGVLLALVAAGCWAAYIVLGGRVARLLPSTQAIAVGMVFAALVVFPFGASQLLRVSWSLRLFATALSVAVLSSALPYWLEMRALSQLPGRAFGILMSIEPAVAALMGMLLLREQLTPPQWLAVALVCAASLGSAVSSPKAEAVAAAEPSPG